MPMLTRVDLQRVRCLQPSILAIISFLFLSFASDVKADNSEQDVIEIALEDVRSLAETQSPYYLEIVEAADAGHKELEAGLQRNNPSLNYDLEFLDGGSTEEVEQMLFLEQTFERPRLYQSRSQSAEYQQEALRFGREAGGRRLISDLRIDYSELILLRNHIETRKMLIEKIEALADVASSQADAGELSNLEQQLIKLSRQSVSSELAELQVAYENQKSEWKERMGVDSATEVTFTSELPLDNLTLPELPENQQQIDNHPELRAADFATRAAGQNIRSAELSRLPEFDVSAGYKRLNPDWNGFLVGVSVPLPIINRNQAGIERRRAEQRQVDYQQQQRQKALQAEWQSQWETIRIYHNELADTDFEALQMDEFGRRITQAFSEGTMSLTEALSALEMGVNGYAAYLSKLKGYYKALGHLEFLTDNIYIEAH